MGLNSLKPGLAQLLSGAVLMVAHMMAYIMTSTLAQNIHALEAPSHIAYCLSAAQELETTTFKDSKIYISKQDELKKQLPPGCLGLAFEVRLRGKGRFQVIASEDGGNSWSVNEKKILVKFDGDTEAVDLEPVPVPTQVPDVESSAPPFAQKDPLALQLDAFSHCLTASRFASKRCTSLFTEVEASCEQDEGDDKRCTILHQAVTSLNLENCRNKTPTVPECELRRRFLVHKCSGEQIQTDVECRELADFLAVKTSLPVGLDRDRDKDRAKSPRAPSAQAAPSAPPTPTLPTPGPTLRHPLASRLSRGFKELVTVCEGAEERQREAQHRLTLVQKESEKTRLENQALKSRLERQSQELEVIKSKLQNP